MMILTRTGHTLRLGAVGGALLLASCGGGGGSEGFGGQSLTDPLIPLVGPTGTYSRTPEEANAALGTSPPPLMPQSAQGTNQFIRLEVPFTVERNTIYDPSPLLAPFSYLNGSITITDEIGNHINCIVLINGFDVFGQRRNNDAGFPHDFAASGNDLNVGPGVILFVADNGDGDLASIAAFGGSTTDSDLRPDTTDISQIRLSFRQANGEAINAFYTVNVDDGTGQGDILGPNLLSVVAETPNPLDPADPRGADYKTRFIVTFSEPCVPTTVGHSSTFDINPFDGNMPLLPTPPNTPTNPLPDLYLTASFNSARSPLFIPCDVNALNRNNIATYIVQPLLTLPPNTTVQVVVVDGGSNRDPLTLQKYAAIDLSGNFHQPGSDERINFLVGPGRAPVNAPVSPEVLYFLPGSGRGIGAIDLNGAGFTTNKPDANAGDRSKAAMVTRPFTTAGYRVNFENAVGMLGFPPGGRHNQFLYKAGLGGYPYGDLDGDSNPMGPDDTPGWQDPTDLGNPGTPMPGINEMSSGYEMLVRNADGEQILTGSDFSDVGILLDADVGEFLDAGIFDTQSVFILSGHVSFFWGAGLATNSIGDPPSPNPPPSRYWLGLQPVDILIDQNNPGAPARLIEGEECFTGDKTGIGGAVGRGFQWVIPNPDPVGIDLPPLHQIIVPNTTGIGPEIFSIGPGPARQSGTTVWAFNARQQIGNYLYVADGENRVLHALNSNTMAILDTIPLPDPTGVAVSSDNRFVFVTNASADAVSVIGADPTRPGDFHQEVARIDVGRGPRPIAAQPDNEDVLVGNFSGSTVSIIDISSLSVRKEIEALIAGPGSIVVAPRQTGFGFASGVYYGYIANFTGNSVLVYESGPSGPQGIGCDNILGQIPTEEGAEEVVEPRGMCYSPYANGAGLLAGGVFLAHRDLQGRGIISQIENSHQAIPGPLPCVLPPGGAFFIPPGFTEKIFEITGQWGKVDGNLLLGDKPNSVRLADFRRDRYVLTPSQPINNADRGIAIGGLNSKHPLRFLPPTDPRAPFVPANEPEKMYVSFDDTNAIQVLDPARLGISMGETAERPGLPPKKLITYFD